MPRSARGAAAVEMALCLLILVPVFLYSLFLDDLLRYSLDAQETALSTAWDFTVQDYSQKLPQAGTKSKPFGGLTVVQKQARLMFCDHESGIDSFQLKPYLDEDGKPTQGYPDCKEADHHQAAAAHVCWLNPHAKQVTCEAPEQAAAALGDPLHGSFQDAFTHGGLIRCSARAVVENYLLPKRFLQEFSKVELTKEHWKGQGTQIHDNSEKGDESTAYFLKEQQLAILTDTWAVSTPANVRPGQRYTPPGPSEQSPARTVFAQLSHVYTRNEPFRELTRTVNGFLGNAAQGQLLAPDLRNLADDPLKPNLAIAPQTSDDPSEKIQQERRSASYFNTEWRDWDKDHHPQIYRRRHAGYLGCKPGEGC
ncbi:MAG: hypothetical protein JXB05_26170 [Myxococcaceae bacterium]|nr:hypothetical protein [Myxococcaceae bacterium]